GCAERRERGRARTARHPRRHQPFGDPGRRGRRATRVDGWQRACTRHGARQCGPRPGRAASCGWNDRAAAARASRVILAIPGPPAGARAGGVHGSRDAGGHAGSPHRARGARDARRADGPAPGSGPGRIPARVGSGTPAASPGRPQAGRRDPQHQRPGRRRRPRRAARAPCRADPLRTALPARGPDAHRHRRPAVTMPMHSRSPRSRLAALALALGFALGTLPVLPLAAQDAAPADGTRAPAMDLRGADLRAFIQDVAVATGTSFIVDPSVQGTVEYTSDHAPEGEELLGVLLAILRGNGLIAVPAGPATYRVIPDDAGAQHPRSAGGAGFGTTVIPLARIDARVAAETLKPLVGRGGVVLASPQGNSLLVADYS